MNLDKIADAVKAGVQMAGGTPILMPAIGVCDGIAMGHVGMKYSLPSRELICDSVETMCQAHQLDGLVLVPNCDKIVPGMVMAACRLDVPAVVCSGGPMLAGSYGGEEVSLSKMFEAVGAYKAGMISDAQLEDCTCNCCPSCGSCSGMYTANSMNCLCEAVGIALPGNGTIPAVYSKRLQLAKHSGMAIMELVRKNITARQIINERSLRNALTCGYGPGLLHQHGAAPAGHRPRGRGPDRPGHVQRDLGPHPQPVPPGPGRPHPYAGPVRRRRHPRRPG